MMVRQMREKSDMNSILVYIAYALAIFFIVAILRRMYLSRNLDFVYRIPTKQKFPITQDKKYVQAVALALKYDDMTISLLKKRLDVDKKVAEDILLRLYDNGIIARPEKEEPAIKVK